MPRPAVNYTARHREQADRRQRAEETAREFAEALEAERERRGITYYELAARCGMSAINVQRVLAGEENPSARRLIALADALGCTLRLERPARKK